MCTGVEGLLALTFLLYSVYLPCHAAIYVTQTRESRMFSTCPNLFTQTDYRNHGFVDDSY